MSAVGLTAVLGPIGILAAVLRRSPDPLFDLALPSLRLLLWMAGVRLEIKGKEWLEIGETYVFMSNHRSNIDPPVAVLSIGRTLRVVTKAGLFRLPVLGRVFQVAGFIPVERQDHEQAVSALDGGVVALTKGHDILAFPEGTRSSDGRLLPFKKGPFVMAIKAQVRIAPLVVRGTRAVQSKGGIRINPGPVEVEFLQPISTTGLDYEDRQVLLERTRNRMSEALRADCS